MKPELTLHGQTLQLNRYPIRQNETLQAWDAADEYLINQVEDMRQKQALTLDAERPVLIMNDSFGALACWFARQGQTVSVGDSYIARTASQHNLAANTLPDVKFADCLAPVPPRPSWYC